MKKNKSFLKKIKEKIKGFTLVELLAIIVILAIIMLIAIPTVLNTLQSARKKAFVEYADKIVGLSEQKYLEGVMIGEEDYTCYIYNIKTDLGLSNTGEYNGYVLVAPTEDDNYQYWLLLYDDNYFLDVIEYKEFQTDAVAKLNKAPTQTSKFDMNYFAKTLKEKGVNCSSFEYNGGSIEPSDNEDGGNEGTDCAGQTVHNSVPKNATGLYKLIAEQAYMDNIKSEHVAFCDGIKITEGSKGYFKNEETNSWDYLENGIGVYEVASTKDNKYPIYYFRGEDIDNNYVTFANKCWRIVKTTPTGGIKIIYNGNTCDATDKDLGIGYQSYDTGYMNIPSNLYMHGPVTPRNSLKTANGTEYLYGRDFTYSNGEYTLVDTISLPYKEDIRSELSTHHYTCLNTTGKCTTINWVYNIYGEGLEYYMMTDGKSFDDALNEMVYSNSVSSLAKQTIDKWYEDNLISYASYIEDTPYCELKKLQSFDAKTADISSYGKFSLKYESYGSTGRSFNNGACEKQNAYTVSSSIGNGALKYPIAILNSDDLFYTGEEDGYSFLDAPASWVMNPKFFTLISTDWGGRGAFMENTKFWDGGGFEYCGGDDSGCNNNIRPAISLKPGTDVSSGDGTKSNPYVIR